MGLFACTNAADESENVSEACERDLLTVYRVSNSLRSTKIYINDSKNHFRNESVIIANWNDNTVYWLDGDTFFRTRCSDEDFIKLKSTTMDRLDKDDLDYFIAFG